MKKIGGYFTQPSLSAEKNGYLDSLVPEEGDLAYLMSGRCGLYYALMDHAPKDSRKVAYVPAYTCETVLAPFEKAGYTLRFYDLDLTMSPVFDSQVLNEISVLLICGYYGFCRYDRGFVKACAQKGICILEDTTHSIFSKNGVDPLCDYFAGSFRKWLGVPSGGFSAKTKGRFQHPLLPPEQEHLSYRRESIHIKEEAVNASPDIALELLKTGDSLFWKAEMELRQIFDCQASDPESIEILEHCQVEELIKKRRANYQYLLENLLPSKAYLPVFPELDEETTPSHFTVYANDRDSLRTLLLDNGIGSTVYWPVGPLIRMDGFDNAPYIYSHVLSIPCDQRYGEQEMEAICRVLNQ